MTVKELIEKLQQFPEHMEVIDYEGNYISKVEVEGQLYHIDNDIDEPFVMIR